MYLARVNFYTRCAIRGVTPAWVKEILLSCTTYDSASGISGALLFNERYFLQSMEGERSLLSNQIVKIAEDERQSGLTIVAFKAISVRMYTGWTVAFAARNTQMDLLYFRYNVIGELDPVRMTSDMFDGLFSELCQIDGSYIQRSSSDGRVQSAGRPRKDILAQ